VPIPLYRHDGALIDWISPSRAERLFTAGDAKLVRHKKGTINRVILHRTPNETLPMRIADYMGKPYSYRQHLDGGQRCWRLKSLATTAASPTLHRRKSDRSFFASAGLLEAWSSGAARSRRRGKPRRWRQHGTSSQRSSRCPDTGARRPASASV